MGISGASCATAIIASSASIALEPPHPMMERESTELRAGPRLSARPFSFWGPCSLPCAPKLASINHYMK